MEGGGEPGMAPTMISYAPHTETDAAGNTSRVSPELGKDPNSGAELLELDNNTNGLLGDWLKYLLDNAVDGNVYNLKGSNSKAPSPKRGVALEPAESTGAENVFVESNSTGGLELNKYSDSGKFSDNIFVNDEPSARTLADIVDKKMGVDGHFMYIVPSCETAIPSSKNVYLGCVST